jgi:feruloyl esterase
VKHPALTSLIVAGALAAAAVNGLTATPARSCESLASLRLPQTTITRAESVPAGAFKPEKPFTEPGVPPANYDRLPAFCRVAGTIAPTNDSDIKFEVWLPLTGWNGKFQAVGNGVWSGQIWRPLMSAALARGYATANTDTGHEGDGMDASFALGHPEKVIDFGYRAVHEMTVKSKAVIAKYYGSNPRYAYWNGCSSGGKQGLKEAQRFPLDYDGIVAGAPGNNWTHLMVSGVWMAQATHRDPAGFIPPAKYPIMRDAVLEACDALDGVKDGVLDDPRRCRFDPGSLACKDGDGPGCLTAPQVEAARQIYAGPKNPRTGEPIYPGLEPGSEARWEPVAGGPGIFGVFESHFKYLVFKDPGWKYLALNFDADVALADRLDKNTINATDPDVKTFVARGGKLLMYHGWNDQFLAPRNTIAYYDSVVAAVGAARARNGVRLFMVPGLAHCGGGDGPASFDPLAALEAWVEKGTAPDQITARRIRDGKVDRTRPLCPYPQVAEYTGSGSTDEPGNFICKTR